MDTAETDINNLEQFQAGAEVDIDALEQWRTEDEPKIDALEQWRTEEEPKIDALVQTVVVADANHAAAFSQIIIVEPTTPSDPIQITLPAIPATLPPNPKVVVKFGENVDNKTVTAAANIENYGTTYSTPSPYESLTFVCSSSKWYII